ncbi:hypothetical protein SDC9_11304 [bioreactor metagenome]|uniref:Divergent polysaccharide deacetylase n=1 Tax=bioreactor metagenome TaxID=1076179 RepID=A0A644TFL6_9ZZZZ|nr:divergent polysaccharide deacetylase family protein [Negativicutes bacterium]
MAKRSKLTPWVIVLMIAITAILYFKVSDNGSRVPQGGQDTAPHYTIEKTGAGAVVDFTAESKKIHSAVDRFINNANLTIKDSKETSKEIPRQQVEGTIRWHVRDVFVSGTGLDIDQLKRSAAEVVKSVGGEVLDVQQDNYQGVSVTRLDLGLRDHLGGDAITIITDRVYVQQEKIIDQNLKPVSKGKGVMAIVIDDFGYSDDAINEFAEINRPLTFAVLPYRSYSSEAASRGLSSGHQVILHLPLEPLTASAQSEQITINSGMNETEVRDTVTGAIHAVPGIIGVNNHQGSRSTADQRVMRQVLTEIKANNLFFVDSRTNSQSVAVSVARRLGVKTAANDLFIDNDNDVSAVKRQLRIARDIALRDGSIIVIGHARMTTATAVREMIPDIEASGIKLIFVSEMVK